MTQDGFIEKLFDDLGFDSAQKRAWLLDEYKVKYADELTRESKSKLIDRLCKMRDDKQEATARFMLKTTFGEEE